MSERLDKFVQQQYNMSRSQAIDAIKQQRILVNGNLITKCSFQVNTTDKITTNQQRSFVSRGGYKLLYAIRDSHIVVKDKTCLDVGASTGGFCDCLLQEEAASVTTIDVGSNQLHPTLMNHPRVTYFEHTNINDVKALDFDNLFDIIVVDVSFTSLAHVFDSIHKLRKENGEMLLLFKPQFEVGKEHLNKKGIVKHPHVVDQALQNITLYLEDYGYSVTVYPCHLKGKEGNQEYFLYVHMMR